MALSPEPGGALVTEGFICGGWQDTGAQRDRFALEFVRLPSDCGRGLLSFGLCVDQRLDLGVSPSPGNAPPASEHHPGWVAHLGERDGKHFSPGSVWTAG